MRDIIDLAQEYAVLDKANDPRRFEVLKEMGYKLCKKCGQPNAKDRMPHPSYCRECYNAYQRDRLHRGQSKCAQCNWRWALWGSELCRLCGEKGQHRKMLRDLFRGQLLPPVIRPWDREGHPGQVMPEDRLERL